MVVLLLVVCVLAGKWAFTSKVPKEAAGASPAVDDSGEGSSAGAGASLYGQGLYPSSTGNSAAHAEREKYLAQMDRNITRDLFMPNPDFYPSHSRALDTRVTLVGQGDGEDQQGWFECIAGWVKEKQEAQRDERARVTLIRARAQALLLQSTMLGPSPTALINGQVLREGDQIGGFRVKKIFSDGCTVTKDGVDVSLQMQE